MASAFQVPMCRVMISTVFSAYGNLHWKQSSSSSCDDSKKARCMAGFSVTTCTRSHKVSESGLSVQVQTVPQTLFEHPWSTHTHLEKQAQQHALDSTNPQTLTWNRAAKTSTFAGRCDRSSPPSSQTKNLQRSSPGHLEQLKNHLQAWDQHHVIYHHGFA